MAQIQRIECSECQRTYEAAKATLCVDCLRPLLVRYDLQPLADLQLSHLYPRPTNLWRYHEVLPLDPDESPLTLGEGFTPYQPLPRIGSSLGIDLWAKNEGFNPTGSFKDRGMAVAMHMVRRRGEPSVRLPSAGNAASSAAAYAARAGIQVRVAMPATTSAANFTECQSFGARIQKVDGSIADAGAWLNQHAADAGLDLSTLKEPFRLEGKKTMGYELFEQGGGQLPDVIIYPTGGGTGLIGMWKAFEELQQAGLLNHKPRMVSVQAEGCAPIVHAFAAGAEQATAIEDPRTVAAGLRVPGAVGDRLILKALRESSGTAVAVSDADIGKAALQLARQEGILTSTEAAATMAALPILKDQGQIHTGEKVVVFLTATGLKTLDYFETLTEQT